MKLIFFVCLSLCTPLRALWLHSKGEPREFQTKDAWASGANQGLVSFSNLISMFDHDLDMEEGEAMVLAHLLLEARITYVDFAAIRSEGSATEAGLESRHMTGRQKSMWLLATKEAKAKGNFGRPSGFGREIPKVPQSWVESIANLSHTKEHKFMFSGSFLHSDLPFRKWLKPFVTKNFNSTDYFRATDAKGHKYNALGAYDISLTGSKGYRPKDHGVTNIAFDQTYWNAMVHSEFVLCPGGDAPYSYRFYEVMATKAIPLINDIQTDWRPSPKSVLINKIGYEHMMTSGSMKYDPAVAERNYAKFIKYQTWIQGDHDPDRTA